MRQPRLEELKRTEFKDTKDYYIEACENYGKLASKDAHAGLLITQSITTALASEFTKGMSAKDMYEAIYSWLR